MGESTELKGLRGWLILVGLGVVIAPIRMLGFLASNYGPVLENGTWTMLTEPRSPAYHPLWEPLLLTEMVFNVALLLASLSLIYLFFSRHYLFPRIYIGVVVASLIFVPLDAWALTFVLPNEPMFDPTTAGEFGRTLITALIWIPYMLVSKRVAQTFVEKKPADGQLAGAETAS